MTSNEPRGRIPELTRGFHGVNWPGGAFEPGTSPAQLKKLPGFARQRRENFACLKAVLAGLPEATATSKPGWFGMVLSVPEEAPLNRNQAIRYPEEREMKGRTN